MTLYSDQVVCDRQRLVPHQRLPLCVNPRVVTWREEEPEPVDPPNIIRGEN